MDQYEDIDKYFQVRVEIGRQEIEEADHFGAFLGILEILYIICVDILGMYGNG